MADLTITPANVQIVSGNPLTLDASVAIVAGKSVYSTSANVWALADATMTSIGYGITVNDAAADQPLTVLQEGVIALGATLQVGMLYCISVNSGLIAPITDLVTPNVYNILGYALDTANLTLKRYSVPIAIA
jgi:hypothetical protein